MITQQFDELAKAIGLQPSRRTILKLICYFILNSVFNWTGTTRTAQAESSVINYELGLGDNQRLSNSSNYRLEEVTGSQADAFKQRAEQNVDFIALQQLINAASGEPNTIVLQLLEDEVLSRYGVIVTYPGKDAKSNSYTVHYVAEVDSNGADKTVAVFVLVYDNAGEAMYGFYKDENGNIAYQSAGTIPYRAFLPLIVNEASEDTVSYSFRERAKNFHYGDTVSFLPMATSEDTICTEEDKSFAGFQCTRCKIGIDIICASTVVISTVGCAALSLICTAGDSPLSLAAGITCSLVMSEIICKKKLGEDFCSKDPCSMMCSPTMCACRQCKPGCEVCDLSNDFSSWLCRDIAHDNNSVCNGKCVNLSGDVDNCSKCGNQCQSNELCIGGGCIDSCPEGYLACPGLSTTPLCLNNPNNNWKCCNHPVTGEPLGACPTTTLCCFPPGWTTLGCCILQYQCKNGVCW